MATKKKTKKRVSGHRRKSRKVGAMKPGSIEHYALMGLGALVGGVGAAYGVQAANTALASTAATTPWLPPALVAGLGLGVTVVGKDNPLTIGVGLGAGAVAMVMVANQTFLNVPGISGMAFSSNAPAGTNVIRKAVGQGPKHYINRTVGGMSRKMKVLGALASN
jgi:hypothetical protein